MISTETKAKIMLPYLGYGILNNELEYILMGVCKSEIEDNFILVCNNTHGNYHGFDEFFVEDCSLLLKSLASISDEDAIEVCRLLIHMNEINARTGRRLVTYWIDKNTCALEGSDWIKIYQYLQSKGYALPYLQYSVEDLINEGIYKLI